MKKSFLVFSFQILVLLLAAQPYVDPFQVRYTYAFRSGGNSRGTPFTHFWAGSDLPIKIKNNSYLLLSPFYENWQIDSASVKDIQPTVHSIVLPIGLILPLKNKKWTMVINPILRSNGEELFAKNTFQFGGVGFFGYERSPGQKIRFGAYMNSDFFGFFFMPLVGADWKIDERNYLFGLLPGRLTWEHQFNSHLFGGMTFRAITNSYRLSDGQYLRIDDNQLSAFLDVYPAKHICFTLEPGYGILRKLRNGIDKKTYTTTDKWGDGLFIKISAAYRVRLKK